jgi:hypothetical protein
MEPDYPPVSIMMTYLFWIKKGSRVMLNVLTAFDTAASLIICRRAVDPCVYVIRGPSNIWIMGSNLGLNMNIFPHFWVIYNGTLRLVPDPPCKEYCRVFTMI